MRQMAHQSNHFVLMQMLTQTANVQHWLTLGSITVLLMQLTCLIQGVQEPLHVRCKALRQFMNASDSVQLLYIIWRRSQVVHHLTDNHLQGLALS